ncbi:hypothetical protein FG91_01635 [Sphingopyxis sp. LC81]|uniref:type IV toxin-antitoxin system AbiEi family antitoxin domain-containing protein n=1 Tax=Sphingopyxis sp. LC81 TaxID=1502850 RepID=UPI00050F9049|nr:type IV toxin-antitoxin system AbiEi family antitoxin domain-containing protein [Sphingopyxis sp. LC81]KGB55006.1 hypothetical protein FG91_01635 [Sphingopyxis sp. LC81]
MTMRLSRLARVERQTIACVRSACFPADAPVCGSDFQICRAVKPMADRLAETRLSIWHPGAMFVSQDEISLLALLAALQRCGSFTVSCDLSPDLIETLRQYATALAEAGARLPFRGFAHAMIERQKGPLESTGLDACTQNSVLRVRDRSVAANALEMVRERELVSTREFERSGISRQYLSLLFKKGHLTRARHGWYRAFND